jgi:hypothetical protein
VSVETSRKFAWLGGTTTLSRLPFEVFDRVAANITLAKNESEFTDETRAIIEQAREEMAGKGRVFA